ncbi:DUF6801 domain-containing protein [Streptomyces sp. NPDC005648]|uniref:DUF6801 domain-containing protein n=1 Tax=Streptomyces sp. NPDC005648 TaxID=3157044 RepID=UPI0033B843E5
MVANLRGTVADSASAGLRRRIAACVTAVALLASTVLLGAGVATAAPAPVSYRFTCGFPVIGGQPMTATVVWPAPATLAVGELSPQARIDAKAVVGHKVTDSLKLVHADTVEGTADVHTVVAAPQGDTDRTVTLTVARTRVPDSGPLTVHATGALPPLVFGEPGAARIVVDRVDLHFTGRGSVPIGSMNGPCELDSGQDGLLARLTVVSSRAGHPSTRNGPASAVGSPSAPPAAAPGTTSDGWNFMATLYTLTALLAMAAAAVGLVWWAMSRRRR